MVSKQTILNDLKGELAPNLSKLKICTSIESSLSESYGICILTEWDEFKKFDFKKTINKLTKPKVFIDGRNIINLNSLDGLFEHVMSLDT